MTQEFSLASLQLQTESDTSIEDTRRVLTEACHWFSTLPDNDLKVKVIFEQLRENFPIDKLKEKDIFFYDLDTILPVDVPSEYKQYSIGLFVTDTVPRFGGRLCYPVRDVKGQVMGIVGWDPGVSPKYLDSRAYGYNAKQNIFYGMEELPAYYTSKEPVFITEGIACCNWLRAYGYQALAMLGSNLSTYQIEILKRFHNRAILLPDNDSSGLYVVYKTRYKLPEARCYVSIIEKDIDDTRRVNRHGLIQDLESIRTFNPFLKLGVLRLVK